jgi:hypothetical protein
VAVVSRKSERRGLRNEDFEHLRSWLRSAAIDYGPAKPVPGSAAYRAWVKRWDLRVMLKIFEAAHFERCAVRLGQVIRGEWPLKWEHLMELEWHLHEAHARWLKDSVAEDRATMAETGRKGAKQRAKKTAAWQEEVTRYAKEMRRKNSSLNAFSIAKTLAARGILRDLNIGQDRAYRFLKRDFGMY